MSDFSLFSLFTAGLACLIPFTSAYTKPVGAEPEGNPIATPGLHTVVPAGTPYSITWQPTTSGTVTLVLLKGPSTNAVPQYAIIENIPNNGNFIWVPSQDLVPSDGDTGYGIQLIDDATGQYQYSTQFGISNADYHGSPSGYTTSGSTASSTSSSGWATTTGNWHGHHSNNGTHAHPTGWGAHNTTKVMPTGHMTKPTLATSTAVVASSTVAPLPSTPAPASATQTGGASTLATSFIGLVFAAGVAVFYL